MGLLTGEVCRESAYSRGEAEGVFLWENCVGSLLIAEVRQRGLLTGEVCRESAYSRGKAEGSSYGRSMSGVCL